MTSKVFAPLIGEGVEELSIVEWKKKLGDSVDEGEALVEVESDKVVTEVTSPVAGTLLEMMAQGGDTVRAGSVLALVGSEGEAVVPTRESASLDSSAIAGASASANAIVSGRRPLGALRRKIAERMIQSQRTSAHVLTVMEADMGAVVTHRATNKNAFAAQGIRLTISAYFVSVLAAALRRQGGVNASFSDEGMILHDEVNVGVAVSLGEEGLIVPVVRKADTLSLGEIAKEIDRLATAARAGKLGTEDVKGGTFTLTNYGTGDSLIAAPIINQPQIGILGTGALQKRAVVVTSPEGVDSIVIRPMVYLSLVFDHRALDGESGGRFLSLIKEGLENWK